MKILVLVAIACAPMFSLANMTSWPAKTLSAESFLVADLASDLRKAAEQVINRPQTAAAVPAEKAASAPQGKAASSALPVGSASSTKARSAAKKDPKAGRGFETGY